MPVLTPDYEIKRKFDRRNFLRIFENFDFFGLKSPFYGFFGIFSRDLGKIGKIAISDLK